MPLGDITKAHSVVPQIRRVGYTRGRARLGTDSGEVYTTEKRSRGEGGHNISTGMVGLFG